MYCDPVHRSLELHGTDNLMSILYEFATDKLQYACIDWSGGNA